MIPTKASLLPSRIHDCHCGLTRGTLAKLIKETLLELLLSAGKLDALRMVCVSPSMGYHSAVLGTFQLHAVHWPELPMVGLLGFGKPGLIPSHPPHVYTDPITYMFQLEKEHRSHI